MSLEVYPSLRQLQQGAAWHAVNRTCEDALQTASCDSFIPSPIANHFRYFPAGTLFLQFQFTLISPYLSKGDEVVAASPQTIAREWVYRRPWVRPSTWKGRLRYVANLINPGEPVIEAFGPDKESKSEGRLHFFPSFFNETNSHVVFNPHNRRARKGTVPVSPHVVRAGQSATFSVLYLGRGEAQGVEQARLLFPLVCDWLQLLFTIHGIGAKTLKGFGLARNQILNSRLYNRHVSYNLQNLDKLSELRARIEGAQPWA